jgi:hypothetical protein
MDRLTAENEPRGAVLYEEKERALGFAYAGLASQAAPLPLVARFH